MIPEAALASFVAALFSMMNPIGGVGVFAGMTADRPGNQAWGSYGNITSFAADGDMLEGGLFGIKRWNIGQNN